MQEAVERLKDGRAELAAGFAEGLSGNHLGFKGRVIERLKKGIQFGLQGAVGLIEQKQDQIGEGQMAFAGKVLGMGAVLGNKIGTTETIGYFMYNFQSGSRWACQALVF
jgi:hypothetical protein